MFGSWLVQLHLLRRMVLLYILRLPMMNTMAHKRACSVGGYTYSRKRTKTRAHTRAQRYSPVFTYHMCSQRSVHVHGYVYVYVYVDEDVCTRTSVYVHILAIHAHVYTFTYTYAYIYICMYMHMHMYTYLQIHLRIHIYI